MKTEVPTEGLGKGLGWGLVKDLVKDLVTDLLVSVVRADLMGTSTGPKPLNPSGNACTCMRYRMYDLS